MKIELEKASSEDWQEVLNYEKGVDSKTFHAMTTEAEVKDFMDKNELFFISADDIKVGAISYEPRKDSNHINELIVAPEHQKQGIGTRAMEVLMNQIGQDKPMDLVTHPENSIAIRIYLKLGFIITDLKDNFYGDGEPRLLLVKEKND